MIVKIGLTYTWTFTVHNSIGRITDADETPVASVFEDDGDTSMDTPTVEKIGSYTGKYRVIVEVASADYSVDKSYSVHVDLEVDEVPMAAVIATFVPSANDLDDVGDAAEGAEDEAEIISSMLEDGSLAPNPVVFVRPGS